MINFYMRQLDIIKLINKYTNNNYFKRNIIMITYLNIVDICT